LLLKEPRIARLVLEAAFLLLEEPPMECRFTFPNGKRCRCRATPSHVFCRQHAPQAHLPRPRPLQPQNAGAGTSFRNWRDLERNLITLEPEELAAEAFYILDALLNDGPRGISERNAGRLLRAILSRLGFVPFCLPDDPADEPEPAATPQAAPSPVSGYPGDPQAFERMISILERYAPFITGQPTCQSGITSVTHHATLMESSAIPHFDPPRG
jgi:hypothetical protein